MKITRNVKLLSMALGIIMIFSTTAHAYNFTYDLIVPYTAGVITFEDGTYTNKLTPFTIGSVGDGSGGTTYGYEIVRENETNQCVRFNDIAAASELQYFVPGNTYSEGKVHFSMDINVKKTGSGTTCPRLYFRNPSWAAPMYLSITKKSTGELVFSVTDATDSGSEWLGKKTYSYDTWYTLNFEFNFTKQLYKAWVVEKATGEVNGVVLERALRNNSLMFIQFLTTTTSSAEFMIDNLDLKYEKMLVKSEPVITAVNGNLTTQAIVRNEFNVPLDSPTLILAVYAENGVMTSISIDNNNKVQIPKNSSVSLDCSLPIPQGTYSAKAFIWTGVPGLKPFCDDVKYPTAE